MTDEERAAAEAAAANQSPPTEPVDERGIPYKQVVAEFQRKAQESDERATLQAQAATRLNEENERYKVALGQARSAAPNQPASRAGQTLDDMEKTFPAETQEYLRELRKEMQAEAQRIAQTTGYGLITDIGHQNTLQDAELMAEARNQMAALSNNPLWANVDQRLRTDKAISDARAVVVGRRSEVATKQAQQDVERARAEAASLPRTTRGAPPPSEDERKKFLSEFKADPENLEIHNKMCRGQGYSPDSEEGQKFLEAAAAAAWKGTNFGGRMATAVQILSGSTKANFDEKGRE